MSQKSLRARAPGTPKTPRKRRRRSRRTSRAHRCLVREDLFRERAILAGRVIVGACNERSKEGQVGLANARIVLEDGSYALTDTEGRWHLDNIRPGTHVVQLDLDSLGEGYEVVPCEDNSRFARPHLLAVRQRARRHAVAR